MESETRDLATSAWAWFPSRSSEVCALTRRPYPIGRSYVLNAARSVIVSGRLRRSCGCPSRQPLIPAVSCTCSTVMAR